MDYTLFSSAKQKRNSKGTEGYAVIEDLFGIALIAIVMVLTTQNVENVIPAAQRVAVSLQTRNINLAYQCYLIAGGSGLLPDDDIIKGILSDEDYGTTLTGPYLMGAPEKDLKTAEGTVTLTTQRDKKGKVRRFTYE